MKQPEKFGGDVPAEAAYSNKERRIQRLDGAIKYYASKMHMIFTVTGLVFGIIELSYGVKYNGQCPIQQMIGIFLIVHGSVMLFEVVIGIFAILIARVIYTHNKEKLARRLILVVLLVLLVVNLFCFAWFIAGSIWVFSAANSGYQSTDSTNLSTYCEMDLFRAALGIVISRYIFVAVIIVVVFVKKRPEIMRGCKPEKEPPANGNESANM